MLPKKAEKVDIDKRRGFYSRLGFIISLSLVILAFQWETKEKTITIYDPLPTDGAQEENIDVTKEPPKKEQQQQTVELRIVDNNVVITDSNTIVSQWVTPMDSFSNIVRMNKTEEIFVDSTIILVPQIPPDFPGGLNEMNKFIVGNIKYPERELSMDIQGQVFVGFVVEKDGSLSNIKILKGISPGIDNEAVRVVKSMPKWKPGIQFDQKVRVSISLPINFKISG